MSASPSESESHAVLRGRRWLIVAVLVFFSGAATVGIEVVWARMLHRVLGSTSSAIAAVLAGFLGGLGLGAYIAERWHARFARPLTAYAAAEVIAAGAALLGSLVLSAGYWLAALPGGDALLLAVVAAATLPAGATFPLLIAALPRDRSVDRELRTVYGVNAIGAALGGLATGLVAIRYAGEWGAVALCTALQGGVGAAALAFVRPRSGTEPPVRPQHERSSDPRGRAIAAVFLFLSGFVVLYWEVLWTRLLVLVVGTTVYAFAVVSSSVVLGIGVGSLLSRRVAFGWVVWGLPALVALAFAAMYFAVPHLPSAYLVGVRTDAASPLVVGTLGAAAVVFAPNCLLGSLFPLAVARWRERVGSLYAVNSVGAALGAFAGGPLAAAVIDLEGAYHSGLVGLVALALTGAVLSLRTETPARRNRSFRMRCTVASTAAIVGCAAWIGVAAREPWDLRRLLAGVYQWSSEDLRSRSIADGLEGRSLLAAEVGREAVVSVELVAEQNTVYFKSNGKVEGSVPADRGRPSLADLPTQILLGELAASIRFGRDGADALLIGLGSGVTLGALLEGCGDSYRPRSVDVIELEPEFLRVLRHERVRPYVEVFLPAWILDGAVAPAGAVPCSFHFGDARRLLASELAGREWDVIVSQPSEPWVPGAAPLFTIEFFERLRAVLRPGGYLVQWLQLYKVEEDTVRLIVRTLRRVFPEVLVARPPGTGELVLVASAEPIALEAPLRAPPGKFQAATLLEMPVDRLALFLGGARGVDEWVGLRVGLPVNSDSRGEALYSGAGSLYGGADRAQRNLEQIRAVVGRDPITTHLPANLARDESFALLLAERNVRFGDELEALQILSGFDSRTVEERREAIRQAIDDRPTE